MRILAIDYGRKKIGVATADFESKLAEPISVIRFENQEEAIKKISEVAKIENAMTVVVGISEGEMAKETKAFGEKLEKEINIPVVFQDETLSTREAQELSINAQIKRKKRHNLEDAYAATLVLQSYLDSLTTDS
jgi:putative Holliday junction resolvase